MIHATGAAPPDIAWQRYTDPGLWPGWAPHIRRVEGVSHAVAPGDEGTVVGPLGARVAFTITSVEPEQRRWGWTVKVFNRRVRLDHGIDPAGTGSTAWVDIHLPSPLVALYAPLAKMALQRLVAG